MQYKTHHIMNDVDYTILASQQVLKLYKLQQLIDTASILWDQKSADKLTTDESAHMSNMIAGDKHTVRNAIRELEKNDAFLDRTDMGKLNRLYTYYKSLEQIHIEMVD